MEHALGEDMIDPEIELTRVLILVLVEHALGVPMSTDAKSGIGS